MLVLLYHYKLLMTKFCIYLLLLLPLCSFGQEHFLRHEYKYRLSNGMDLLLVEDAKASETTLFLSGRLGPYLEDSTTDGAFIVCFELLKAGLTEQLSSSAKVDGYMRSEFFMFKLSGLPADHIEPAVKSIQTIFTKAWWDSTDLEKAKVKALQWASVAPLDLVGEKLSAQIWGMNAPQMSELAPTEHLLALDSSLVNHVLSSLFCPSLMQLSIHSPMDHRALRTQMILLWNDWFSCRVPHSVVNFVPSYRPMPFSLQNLEVAAVDKPTYIELVQGPSVFNGDNAILFGLVIEELLAISDTAAMLLDSLHLTELTIDKRGGRYASELWLYAKYNGDSSIISGHTAFTTLIDSLTDTTRTFYTQAEMARAKAVVVDLFQDTVLGAHRTLLLARHGALSQEQLTSVLSKELDKLTPADMVKGLNRYFMGTSNASAIILPDSSFINDELTQGYVSTDPSILDHVFHFKKNTGVFADSAYGVALNQLYQYMQSNDFSLQIVGLSSKEELGHVTDAEMVKFFQHEAMPYMVTSGRKAKRDNVPLELYRVMVVMRYLVERGINPHRLLGTGMRLPKHDPFIERAGTVNVKMQY